VRWYISYRLSYRDLVELMADRGVAVSHTTIMDGDPITCPSSKRDGTVSLDPSADRGV